MADQLSMRELEESIQAEDIFDDELFAFAAFALAHAACGDVMELRIGERCILEWCPSCAVIRTFVSPGG